MRRLTLLALLSVLAAAPALPASAAAPLGWHAGSGVDGSFTVLRAASPSVALAGGFNGALARTTDGGVTWTMVTPPTDAQVRDLTTADGNTIFAVDTRGLVSRSTDGGGTWTALTSPGGDNAVALATVTGGQLLLAARRSLLLSGDNGDTFQPVTPKLAATDIFKGVDRAGPALVVFGSRALLVSSDGARSWTHIRLPGLERGDGVLAADFTSARTGYVLTTFRRLFRTDDAGRRWREMLATGGAGAALAFSDARRGYIAAPGLANRFDGYVLQTTDGGATWRPQFVSGRFLGAVAAAGANGYAIGNEGTALFSNQGAGESGTPVTVGFRPSPRRARRGDSIRIRGRVAPATRGVGVIVSMRSAGRWITRYVRTGKGGVFSARFGVQRRAWFVAQVPASAGHGSAATKAVFVPVSR